MAQPGILEWCVTEVEARTHRKGPSTAVDALTRGREAYDRRAWREAFDHLSAADQTMPLAAEDVERLATSAILIGRDDGPDLWARAHQEFLNRGDAQRAARCAFWVAFLLMTAGKSARGSGWISRGRRLLEDEQEPSAVHGLLLIPLALQYSIEGNPQSAYGAFAEAGEIADRHHDRDLSALARHGLGRALIHLGKVAEGVTLLDESMVAVTADEVSPIIVGGVYCSVIAACREIFDLRRAQEWTTALNEWCATQPDAVQYRGYCCVHRAEMMRLHGAWLDAIHEAQQVSERLSSPQQHPATGEALYQQAEVHRLRGDLVKAEEEYRQASQLGRKPYPGLSQLRLAQGQVDAAAAAIRLTLEETSGLRRARILPAFVEIMLASRDVSAARLAADELIAMAARLDAPFIDALAADALGAVLLAENDPRRALASLRRAWTLWREFDAPYDASRTRVAIAVACRALGDIEGAAMELDAARQVFEQLGAASELARLEDVARQQALKTPSGLSVRESQVLRLVATGRTNRAIADELGISEKTVARHVSNIFVKLNLSTRAAATAYAFQHDLR
jgi:DNA-binding CsgD family transcriptional regulator